MGRDIYSTKEWQELYADRGGLKLDSVCFTCDAGRVEYEFLCRPVIIHEKEYPYMDIFSPYAFSGHELYPAEDTKVCSKELAEQFDEFFDQYCSERGIIAEFAQFNPWVGNEEPFLDIYKMVWRANIIGIDLTKPDLMRDEFNARRRRSVRSAMKQGVEVVFDYKGELIDEFLRLYEFTLSKYNVDDYYVFERSFIAGIFEKLKGKVYFAACVYEGKYVSICMVLESEKYAHYHLAGHDPAMLHTNASSLLMYAIAKKAQDEGKRYFIMGGEGDPGLAEFKRSFTQDCIFDYYCGQKIRNPEVYDMLVTRSGVTETGFFPAYRG